MNSKEYSKAIADIDSRIRSLDVASGKAAGDIETWMQALVNIFGRDRIPEDFASIPFADLEKELNDSTEKLSVEIEAGIHKIDADMTKLEESYDVLNNSAV